MWGGSLDSHKQISVAKILGPQKPDQRRRDTTGPAGLGRRQPQRTLSSSMSNTSVAFGPITAPAPRAP